jgi:hypothetical protein
MTLKERRRWRRWCIHTCRAFGCTWELTFRVAALWEECLDGIE